MRLGNTQIPFGVHPQKKKSGKGGTREIEVTIVVADDHAILRHGLSTLLASNPKFKVVGEAADGREAIALVKKLRPAVLIVDLTMPGLNGLETLKIVKRLNSKTSVIVLSMHWNEGYVLEAMRKGALGYVSKDSGGADLFKAINEALAGRRFISPIISDNFVDSYSAQGTILQKVLTGMPDPFDTLTTREKKVLKMVVEGTGKMNIGIRLNISSRAVENHKTAMLRKLGLKNSQELIRYSLQRGVLPEGKPKNSRKK